MTILPVTVTTDFSFLPLDSIDTISFDNATDATTATFLWRQFDGTQISAGPLIIGSAAANMIVVKVATLDFNALPWQFSGWNSEDRVIIIDSAGGHNISGTSQNDFINGRGGNDLLNGEGGNDSLHGGYGDDFLFGSYGDDLLIAGSGSDTLYGDFGDDTLLGGPGDDTLSDGWDGGNDYLRGGDGNDQIYAYVGNDTLIGGLGDDRFYCHLSVSGGGADQINGGAGTDWLELFRGGEVVAFTVDIRNGGGGADIGDGTTITSIESIKITTSTLDDVIYGGDGGDILNGSSGNDSLYGGGGDDQLLCYYSGGDLLDGGAGDDFLKTEKGQNTIDGGGGVDTLDYYCGDAQGVTLDISSGGGGIDIGNGTRISNAEILKFQGSFFADIVTGGSLNDQLIGYFGNDVLTGMGGDDTLWAGVGDDSLSGGTGSDVMLGGSFDKDVFLFTSIADSSPGPGHDTIGDFENGRDKIDLSAIDADAGNAPNDPFAFIGAANFSGIAGELRITGAAVDFLFVEGDTNGDGIGDFEIAVKTNAVLTAGDFVL